MTVGDCYAISYCNSLLLRHDAGVLVRMYVMILDLRASILTNILENHLNLGTGTLGLITVILI